MKYTIVHYSVVKYTIVHYSVVYYTIVHYSVVYYTIVHYSVVYYTTVYYTIVHYSVVKYTIVHYSEVYYTIVHYSVVYYIIVHYSITSRPSNLCAIFRPADLTIVNGFGQMIPQRSAQCTALHYTVAQWQCTVDSAQCRVLHSAQCAPVRAGRTDVRTNMHSSSLHSALPPPSTVHSPLPPQCTVHSAQLLHSAF